MTLHIGPLFSGALGLDLAVEAVFGGQHYLALRKRPGRIERSRRRGVGVIRRLFCRVVVWVDRFRCGDMARRGSDSGLDRYIASSLTDETLAWALGTWSKRYR